MGHSEMSCSALLDMLSERTAFEHMCHVVEMSVFHAYQHVIRRMIGCLDGDDDVQVVRLAQDLRIGLARLHFSPRNFRDTELFHCVLDMEFAEAERKHGKEFRELLVRAVDLQEGLYECSDSPVAKKLKLIIKECQRESMTFRVLCHGAVAGDFRERLEDLAEDGLDVDGLLLRSNAQYRDTGLFDVLVRLGPMRTEGLGRVPDGVLSAPKFARLEQVIWEGALDDGGIGYDAIGEWTEADGKGRRCLEPHHVCWIRQMTTEFVESRGVPPVEDILEDDEAVELFFRHGYEGQRSVEAVLVTISDAIAVFLRRGSKRLCIDPSSDGVIVECKASELRPGMYLVQENLEDPGLSGSSISKYEYATVWKRRLEERWQNNPKQLLRELRNAGISVTHLETSVVSWIRNDRGCMIAPRRVLDRRVLLDVLGLREEWGGDWVNGALREIRGFRGEAVIEGTMERQIVTEALLRILESMARNMLSLINDEPDRPRISLGIPVGMEVAGTINLYRVDMVEGAYSDRDEEVSWRVPEEIIDKPIRPEEAEVWRG